LVGKSGGSGVGFLVAQRAEGGEADCVQPHVDAAAHEAGDEAVARPQGLDVADLFQVLADRAGADIGLVGGQFVLGAPGGDGGMGGFGCGLAREHGIVVALDAGDVHQTRRAAEKGYFGIDCQPPSEIARAP
jgi:hypothetical protein